MENNKQAALDYLESQGCSLNSFIIDYGIIANYLVNYANKVTKSLTDPDRKEIKAGDVVEVCIPMFSSKKFTHVVKEIKDGWAYFENDAGSIQIEFCEVK